MLEDALYRDLEEDSFSFYLALFMFGIKDLITRRLIVLTGHKIFGYSESGQLPSVSSYEHVKTDLDCPSLGYL